jgi:hypothetical protein
LIISPFLFSQNKFNYILTKKITTQSNNDKSETLYSYDKKANLTEETTRGFSQFITDENDYNCEYSINIKYEYNKNDILKNENKETTYDYKDYMEGWYDTESYSNIDYLYNDHGKISKEIITNKYRSDYYNFYYDEDEYNINKTINEYVYNKSGKLIELITTIKSIPPRGKETTSIKKITYQYNKMGLLKKEITKEGEKIYKYDCNGNLISTDYLHAFGSGNTTYKYDKNGNLIEKNTFSEMEMGVYETKTQYEYDENGLLVKEDVITLNYVLGNEDTAEKITKEIIYKYKSIDN